MQLSLQRWLELIPHWEEMVLVTHLLDEAVAVS